MLNIILGFFGVLGSLFFFIGFVSGFLTPNSDWGWTLLAGGGGFFILGTSLSLILYQWYRIYFKLCFFLFTFIGSILEAIGFTKLYIEGLSIQKLENALTNFGLYLFIMIIFCGWVRISYKEILKLFAY